MIYSIHPDIEKFQLFSIDGKFARKALGEDTMFHFDESPTLYSGAWKPMELEFYISGKQKTLPIPDISQHYGRLFLNEKAYAALKDILEPCGEFLPVFHAGGTGYLFNLLALKDNALNKDLCKKNEWVRSFGLVSMTCKLTVRYSVLITTISLVCFVLKNFIQPI